MSYILELLGRGVDSDLSDLLDRYFWSPSGGAEHSRGAAKAHQDSPERRLQVGLAHLRAGRLDDAVRHFDDACRAKGDCLAARAALASAHDEKGDPASALEHLKVADEIRPNEVAVLFGIGFCLEKLQAPGEATAYYRRAIAADESFMPARERLAAIGVLTGDLDEAIEQYESLRDLEPREICYRSALAHLYLHAGWHGEAVDEFETAIALEPDNWALVDDDVEALAADGQIAEAMERLHALISQQGPFADLHVRLGDLCSRVRDDDGALKNYLLALDLQPGYLEATVKLGTHHLINGRWDEAAEAFHRSVELNDRLLTCYVGMGAAQLALGQADDARNSFDLAGAVEPN
ncbi:MAG: tetratricopeptide repeat protein, partial [Phycisphaerae bacterium]